jgi:hypothetical protein
MADRIEEKQVGDALARRSTSADVTTREALRVLATGVLRQFHTGTPDPIMEPLKELLGVDEAAQFAQCVVDWYLDGRRDTNPPFPERPQMRSAMGALFQKTAERDSTAEELDVLVNALAGAEEDLVLTPSPLKRMSIAQYLVNAFARGLE